MISSKKLIVFSCINILVLQFSIRVFSCTIFYIANDTVILAGNNEDWEDPLPRMWFYPSTGNKYGWIKFGWGSGFPQGGMNDQGLFWDGSSGPYLEMPYSESNKEKYPGPLMLKVIEECAKVEEAINIFSNYYCEDQYKAQYLIGDSKKNSIIVEGDSIILMGKEYLILTNFYHSHTELGGYPCWRYDITNEMITNSKEYTTYLIGSILSATHQEDKYPTQYSQIYDIKNRVIYLFYFHNYEEYIKIDLKEELHKGYRSFDIPILFSKVKLLTPAYGESIISTNVNFCWEGKPGNYYELVYSTDEKFEENVSKVISQIYFSQKSKLSGVIFMAGLIIFFPLIRRKKFIYQSMMILVLMLLNLECKKEDIPPTEEEVITMNETVEDLLPNTIYYWKIISTAVNQDDFQSETLTKYFITGSLK